jgi:hypothetical protein
MEKREQPFNFVVFLVIVLWLACTEYDRSAQYSLHCGDPQLSLKELIFLNESKQDKKNEVHDEASSKDPSTNSRQEDQKQK